MDNDKLRLAAEWEENTDCSNLGETVEVPRMVFEVLALGFENGFDRNCHLLSAFDHRDDHNWKENAAAIRAIQMVFDRK
jgi:hypothetical protein